MDQSTGVMASVLKQLNETHAGDPWYGSSRTRVLAGITAHDAAAHPIANGHSIWELVLHMTAWTRETTRRLGGVIGDVNQAELPAPFLEDLDSPTHRTDVQRRASLDVPFNNIHLPVGRSPMHLERRLAGAHLPHVLGVVGTVDFLKIGEG